MSLRWSLPLLLFLCACAGLASPHAPAAAALHVPGASGGAQPDRSLDAFMERVLARRDDNWQKLRQYVLEERERFDLTGPDASRLYGFEREYTWFIRDGYFIRSPLEANGVAVSEAERRRYEEEWKSREQRRERRAAERTAADSPRPASPEPAQSGELDAVLRDGIEPRFVSAAYFLRFQFDPGQYALAGRERLADRDVLRIEYYPTRLFKEGRTRPNKRLSERDAEIGRKLNKVSLVTLWVDPAEHQIIQYTFDDIDMDFLPARSLIRVEDLKASMRMHQPFRAGSLARDVPAAADVWLPHRIDVGFRLTLAVGPVAARYGVEYHDFRLAEVKTRVP